MSKRTKPNPPDLIQVCRVLSDGSQPTHERAIPVSIVVSASHVEVTVLDARGAEVAIARVEHWNGEIVAHLWDAATVSADDAPQTIHLIDAARVQTKGQR